MDGTSMQNLMVTEKGNRFRVNMSEESMLAVVEEINRRRNGNEFMRDIMAEVKEKYGLTQTMIYRIMHVSKTFKAMDKRKRLPDNNLSERNMQIVAQYDGGKTISQISRELGLTRQRVQQIVRRARPELLRKKKEVPSNHATSPDLENNDIYVENF